MDTLLDPGEFPSVDNGDILLAPGTDVYMSLQKKPYSEVDCNDDPGYSYVICRSECVQPSQRKVFDCGHCSIASDSDAPCSFLQDARAICFFT